MSAVSRQDHWRNVYASKRENEVSWFQDSAVPSLELIEGTSASPHSHVIDIGGGASRLVDNLIAKGFNHLAVLDLSETALRSAQARLGASAAKVEWIVADVAAWEPQRLYDVWHDRAAFHFLTEAADRAAYIDRLGRALRPGGHAIIATFALDGPERCSGLPVIRYDAASLSKTLGPPFDLMDNRRHEHITPWGAKQQFQFSVLRLRPAGADIA
ncbi:MAG TPA: class I SAM-dependent methyltransferase [Roseiarcus sp.]|jgi:SAM-dependent methyltransferase|nr:class I SAM-dependent methyltransferase [Roseiarcus sp.]